MCGSFRQQALGQDDLDDRRNRLEPCPVALELKGERYRVRKRPPSPGALVSEWRELEDVVAGRAVAIGMALDGSAAAVLELDDHRPLEPCFTEAGDAIARLGAQLSDVALRVRDRDELLSALDAVSRHVLLEVQRTLEQQLWMLRSLLAD